MENTDMSAVELREKLENLQRREFEVIKDKKAAMAVFRDELKEIKDEIKESLEQIDEINTPNA